MKQLYLYEVLSMSMEFLLSSSVLFTTSVLLLLISFISSHISRNNKGDSLNKDVSRTLVVKENREFNNLNSDNTDNKEEASDFTFKFQYQIPNQPDNKEENQAPTATTAHKYQFISDRDVSGFVKEPEIQVCHVEESCLDSAISCSNEDENENNQLDTIVLHNYQFIADKDVSGFVKEPEIQVSNVAESCFDSAISCSNEKENENSQLGTNGLLHNYQSKAVKDVSSFVKEPEIQVFHVEESCLNSAISCSTEKENKQNLLDTDDLLHDDSSFGAPHQDVVVKTVDQPSLTIVNKSPSSEILEEQIGLKDLVADSFADSWGENKGQTLARFLSEEFACLNSDSESGSISDGYSVKDLIVDSDGILSDEDDNEFGHKSVIFEESAISSTYNLELQRHRALEEVKSQYFHDSNREHQGSKDSFPNSNHEKEIDELTQKEVIQIQGEAEAQDFDAISIELIDSSDDELLLSARDKFSSRENSDKILSEEEVVDQQSWQETSDINEEQSATELSPNHHSLQPMNMSMNNASEKSELLQLKRDLDKHEPELDETKETAMKGNDTSQKSHMKNANDDDNSDDFDSLWEHEDLIEQLKMEIKRTRTNGLPTILEESESLKSDDDMKPFKIDEKFLKPCKIDEKFLHEDPISELHKFYKSYIERMRKLDILNYQKLYATGFLQPKDPLELLDTQKFCTPSLSSIMLQNCPLRRKSSDAQSENYIKELRCDLELVYVAQMCLSWEFLRWQYEKARDLSESDSHIKHHYNQVAGEFQKFQVVIQRFIENETFQGPRLQNYVKNRCILRNLLQVPVAKEDSLKDKKEDRQKDNFKITIEMLEDIMEESIRIFWEFVKGDKDETLAFLKSIMGSNTELQNPSDYELLKEIQSDLQKKEKKLNDILRTGNCLVKKFKKPKEDRSNQNIFFSQIDLKLVARVLRMPRITSEQLLWCQKKLCKITIVERKIHREASFFLFPC